MSRTFCGGVGILLVALPLLVIFATTQPALTLTDLATGERVLCRMVSPGAIVHLTYAHSMYGGDVTEQYVVTENHDLQRTEFATANAASAEYYAYDRRVRRQGNRFLVDVGPEMFRRLIIQVDEIGRHRLAVGREQIDLVDHVGGRRTVRLRVERVTIVERVFPETCRGGRE